MTTCSTYVNQLIQSNASIVRDLAKVVAKVAPKAYIGVISNPVNSTVPIVAEVFKKEGVYDPKRLFGVTTLDVVRAATFVSEAAGKPLDAGKYHVPVVGGHSGVTIIPLLSQTKPSFSASEKEIGEITHHIQFGGDEVVKAKDGAGSATLSMAYAAAVFTEGLLKGLDGEAVTQCTFVESPLFKDQVDFFASPVEFGPEGVKNIPALPKLTAEEQKLLDACLPDLAKSTYMNVVADNRHQEGRCVGRREPVNAQSNLLRSLREGKEMYVSIERRSVPFHLFVRCIVCVYTTFVTEVSTKRDTSQPWAGVCKTPASSNTLRV